MAFISLTRLRVRSKRYLLPFLWYSLLSARQVQRSPGFLAGKLMLGRKRTYWTVTAWNNEKSMKAFRIAGAHRPAMLKLLDWCDEASIAHWVQDSATLPGPQEAHRRMISAGRTSKVHHPSPRHGAHETAEVSCAIRFEQALSPRTIA